MKRLAPLQPCRLASEWRSGPFKPANWPIAIRTRGSDHWTLHYDSWLAREIHGVDCEWAEVEP